MSYFVYILKSQKAGRFYTGSAADPADRLLDHNTTTRGFTARHRPWEIAFKKDLDSKSAAQIAERRIKNWKSRRMTQLLIDGTINLE